MITTKQKDRITKLISEAEAVASKLYEVFNDIEGDACENEDELLSGIAAQIERACDDISEAVDPLRGLCK